MKLNMVVYFHSFCRYLDYSATKLKICPITAYCYEYDIGIDVSLTKNNNNKNW